MKLESTLVMGNIDRISDVIPLTPDSRDTGVVLSPKESLHIMGWIIDGAHKSIFDSVYISIDDSLYKADSSYERPDISKWYGEQCLLSGFDLSITIPDLNPGEYIIKIVGATTDGKYYCAENTLKIIIKETGQTLDSIHVPRPVQDDDDLRSCIDNFYSIRHYPKYNYTGMPKQVYIIAASYRSGSNLLVDLMARTGLVGVPSEYFNFDDFYPKASKCHDFTMEKYLQLLINLTTTPNGIFGAKVFPHHYFNLNCPLEQYNPQYIYIARRNKIRQGISYYKALKTVQCSSFAEPAKNLSVQDFSYDEIVKCISSVTFQDEAWQRFFQQQGITPVHIVYEDFIRDMGATVSRVLKEAFDIDFPSEKVAAPIYDEQSDDLTEYFYHNLINSFVKNSAGNIPSEPDSENAKYSKEADDECVELRTRSTSALLPKLNPITVSGWIESICNSIYVDFSHKTYPREAVIPKGTSLAIVGWIINDLANDIFDLIYVCIDETMYMAEKCRRSDLVKVRGGEEHYLMAGFRLNMPMPPLDNEKGHTLRVIGVTAEGNAYASKDSVKFTIADEKNPYFENVTKRCHEQTLHPNDYILIYCIHTLGLDQGIQYYLEDGKNSANKLKLLCQKLFPRKPKISLFEFASGYGCVTRHFDMDYFNIISCAIHESAIDFIRDNFNVDTVLSKTNPDEFMITETFDVVFALSFFSHMPDETFGKWIRTLYNCVKPGGVLVFTTHGKVSNDKFIYSSLNNGYSFAPASEQTDLSYNTYGITVSEYSYVLEVCEKYINTRPTQWKEGIWWEHQDLYIIAK